MLAKQIVEQRHREIWHEASSRGQAKASPEQEERFKEVRRMAAACDALAGFLSLDDADVAGGSGRAMGDAAMAMMSDPEVKAVALTDMANAATRSDRPAVWQFCADHGFDASGPDSIFARDGQWSRSDSRPMAWIGKALSAGSWNMAKMLAALPEGKIGVPEPKKDEPADAPADGKKRAKAKKKAEPFDSEAFRHWEAAQASDYWLGNHPTLIAWSRNLEGEKSFPMAVKKALAEHGFEPCFGELAFDIAAADLALRGGVLALAACVKANINPMVALAHSDLDDDQLEWTGNFPKLARNGGVLAEKDALASWTPVASWIDTHLGAGFSEKLCASAALSILRQWTNDHFREFGGKTGRAATAIAWLESHGPQDLSLAGSELAQLQAMAIDMAEADKGKPRPEQARIAALMDRWSVAATGKDPKPRRALKV